MPAPSSCWARRLAPCLVRVKTSTCAPAAIADQVRQQVALVLLRHAVGPLIDAVGGRIARRDLDGHRIVQQARREIADVVGVGGREQQVLPPLRQELDDARMAWMKPMSSMRSASSSTKRRDVATGPPRAGRQDRAAARASRPGDHSRCAARSICGLMLTPPKTTQTRAAACACRSRGRFRRPARRAPGWE